MRPDWNLLAKQLGVVLVLAWMAWVGWCLWVITQRPIWMVAPMTEVCNEQKDCVWVWPKASGQTTILKGDGK